MSQQEKGSVNPEPGKITPQKIAIAREVLETTIPELGPQAAKGAVEGLAVVNHMEAYIEANERLKTDHERAVEQLKGVISDQKAKIENLEAELSGQKRIRRREFLKTAIRRTAGASAAVAIIGGIGTVIYEQRLSPAAQTRKAAEEKARKEREQQEKIEFEKNGALTTEPSIPSDKNWTIQLPEKQPDVIYTKSEDPRMSFLVNSGDQIQIPTYHTDKDGNYLTDETSIWLLDYQLEDGTYVPELRVQYKEVNDGLGVKGLAERHYVGKNSPDPKADTSCVQFTDVVDGSTHYVGIERVPTKDIKYKISVLEKIQLPPR